MGTDIHGWVEVQSKATDSWFPVIDVSSLVDRNYTLFSWLFGMKLVGVKNRASDIKPLAPGRGLPQDVSEGAKADYEDAISKFPQEFHSATWITWAEIQSINWDEVVEDRILRFRIGKPANTWVESWKDDFLEVYADHWQGDADDLKPGHTWEHGQYSYRVEATRRRDVLEGGWALLFRLLEVLATSYDANDIRMVVWFDN